MKEEALEVPLVERLESIPKDARLVIEDKLSSSYFAIGSMCHEASAMIHRLVEELEKQK